MINQLVVEKLSRAIYLYNADCSYTEIAKYLEIDIASAIKIVQAANILEGIEL